MIVHWDLVQGTEDWHRMRYGKIGGTLSKGLLVKSDTLLIDILSCHLEPFEMPDDSYESADMLRGTELEPIARRELSKYAGVEFKESGWLQCDKNRLLGLSSDGVTQDLKIACEIKCPGRKKHTETLIGGVIPDDHEDQCVHNFLVNPHLELLYFCSFRPESDYPLFVRTMTRDSKVNIGTKAKPAIVLVSDICDIKRASADNILENIDIHINNLNKI